MTHEEAERERDQMAKEHPDSTWLIAEPEPGKWSVVKVGLKPSANTGNEAVESRPRPPHSDDPRTALRRNVGSGYS